MGFEVKERLMIKATAFVMRDQNSDVLIRE